MLGLRQRTKSVQKSRQTRPIFMGNGDNCYPHASSGLDVTHYGLGSDLSFVHEKINLRRSTNRLWFARLNKHSSQAQIPNAQDIILSAGTPIHPNRRRFYARGPSEGVRWHLQRSSHKDPCTRGSETDWEVQCSRGTISSVKFPDSFPQRSSDLNAPEVTFR